MILGIDLGQRTTGIAISQGTLASPLTTIRHQSQKDAVEKVANVCRQQSADTVVIGYVEGKTKPFFEKFAIRLKVQLPSTKVILWDETLTSRQARETMIKLQVAKTKRAQKEHETAASIILQSYLDNR